MRKFKLTCFYALVTPATDEVVVFTKDLKNLKILESMILDSSIICIQPTNYLQYLFFLFLENTKEPYRFKYDREKKYFFTNNFLNPDKIKNFNFQRQKYVFLKLVSMEIESLRYLNYENLVFQNQIYQDKYLEALRYKESNYPDKDIKNYPYIRQTALVSGEDYRKVAEIIIAKHFFLERKMQNSEYLRIKYFSLFKKSKNLSELKSFFQDFKEELRWNSK